MININLKSLVGKLNPTCRVALESAAGLCLSRSHYNVELEHWLIKLMETDDSDLQQLLTLFDVDPGRLQQDLNRELDRLKTGNTRAPALSPSIVDLVKNAWMMASVEYGHGQTTSGHLLAALLLDDTLRRYINLATLLDIPAESLREAVRQVVGSTGESSTATAEAADAAVSNAYKPSKTPSLDQFTVNLTEAARNGRIDPVLGRDGEIRQIIDILTRRRQNNPILTGEAGVGKTAVVEGFALRIATGDVPEPLQHVAVRTLDLGLLQAGASVKGEFENRLKSVIAEVNASAQPIILFIDEAHTMIGAGGKEGQGDAANLLKPALARGELRTIAATTWAEYKKYFERDPALTRRFQVVKVEEPDESRAVDMMRAMADMLQNHHGVRILDEAIIDSVRLSSRYITARQLPDKCVSLLDTACARVALSQSTTPAPIEDTRRRIQQCERNRHALAREDAAHGNCHEAIAAVQAELEQLQHTLNVQDSQWQREKDLVTAIHALQKQLEDNFNTRSRLHQQEGAQSSGQATAQDGQQQPQASAADNAAAVPEGLCEAQLASLKTRLQASLAELEQIQGETPMIQVNVNRQAVAEVVANWTGIPVGKMLADEINRVLALQDALGERIIGQTHALDTIAENIRTARAGLTDPRKPIGVFFMVGPSGVGKTETALALAEILYGGEQNITTINMSEFKEEHKVSMLLGSPPGYVGYGEGGVLTEAVRRKPYSVILLDEMEKAHPGVQDIFYNLFDKGTIRDGEGRDIDFRNTVIIMTSNAGEEHIRAMCAAAEERPAPEVLLDNFRPQLLRYFKPAFLGRSTLIPFFPLGDDHLMAISRINLQRIAQRVRQHYNASLSYDEEVLLHIVARSQEVDTGARNIENIMTRTILPALAEECLTRMADGETIDRVHIACSDGGEFTYRFTENVLVPEAISAS